MEDLSLRDKKVENLFCPELGRKRIYQRPFAEVVNQTSYLMNGETTGIDFSGETDPKNVEAKSGVFEDLSQEDPGTWGEPWSDE